MSRIKTLIKNEPLRIIAGLTFFIPALIIEHTVGISLAIWFYLVSLIIGGYSVFIDAVRGIIRLDLLDEKFLMSVASVGAIIIGEASEGVAVMLFFLVGEYFEHRAVRKSRNSIKSLMDIRPDTARVLSDGVESEEDAEDVPVGTVIVIRPGERVPIDAEIIEGEAELDTSALTGESAPRAVTVGDTVDSGVVVLGGVLICRTLRVADESRAARVLELVECATERKSKEENFITAFSRIYTPIVTLLAVLMAIVPPLFNLIEWKESVYRALSFLVVSCPCALVISVPMAFFGGIGAAASKGILYKGGSTFSAISRASTFVFDKTGTLTGGNFVITSTEPVGVSAEELLSFAASAEQCSNHPVAMCLKNSSDRIIPSHKVEERVGKGVVATFGEITVAVGNLALMKDVGASAPDEDAKGRVYVARDGAYIGSVTVSDEVKPEAADAVLALRNLGTKKTVMLSGDYKEGAERVGAALGIDEIHSELLPEDKFRHLENIIESTDGSVVYVGDGINDAPCLARADVGIAMGSRGSDSAIEQADAVIMSDNLDRLADTVKIARKTLRIAKENIVFAIGIKLLVIILVSFDLAGMWMAVFADVGVAVLAILNSMRTLLFARKVKTEK